MSTELPLLYINLIAIAIGIIFFFTEYFEHPNKLHTSLVAGISIAYFFLLVLPEITVELSGFDGPLEVFDYMPILLGFTIIHVSEKLIFKKVEQKTKERARELLYQEKNLELVELNMATMITDELNADDMMPEALRELGNVLSCLNDSRLKIMEELEVDRKLIANHINTDFQKLRGMVNYIYHFIIGVILIDLLEVNFLAGILFSIFVFLMTLVRNKKTPHVLFYDLNIEVDKMVHKKKTAHILLSASVLTGILVGLLIDQFFPINIEILSLMFAMVSGVILYIIIKNDIPDNEEGKPLLFVAGMVGFSILLFIIKYFEHSL